MNLTSSCIIASCVRDKYNWIPIYCCINLWFYIADSLISQLQSYNTVTGDLAHLSEIGIDSFTHGIISSLLWYSTALKSGNYRDQIYTNLTSLALSFCLGCAVDIDHFLEAQSLTLFGATHLSHRPFGHALIIALLPSLILRLIYRQTPQVAAIYFIAVFSHQLRDSVRRGLWFWPWGHSKPLSREFVLILYGVLIISFRYCFIHINKKSEEINNKNRRSTIENQIIEDV
jgi:hypothetical protein